MWRSSVRSSGLAVDSYAVCSASHRVLWPSTTGRSSSVRNRPGRRTLVSAVHGRTRETRNGTSPPPRPSVGGSGRRLDRESRPTPQVSRRETCQWVIAGFVGSGPTWVGSPSASFRDGDVGHASRRAAAALSCDRRGGSSGPRFRSRTVHGTSHRYGRRVSPPPSRRPSAGLVVATPRTVGRSMDGRAGGQER